MPATGCANDLSSGKIKSMKLVLEKERIKKEIDAMNDEHLLRAITEMLNYAKASKEERLLKPFTKQQLIKRSLKSEKDIKVGRTTSLKDLRKEVRKW